MTSSSERMATLTAEERSILAKPSWTTEEMVTLAFLARQLAYGSREVGERGEGLLVTDELDKASQLLYDALWKARDSKGMSSAIEMVAMIDNAAKLADQAHVVLTGLSFAIKNNLTKQDEF